MLCSSGGRHLETNPTRLGTGCLIAMHSVADISVLLFFFLSSCVFLLLTFFSSIFLHFFFFLFLFPATRHYIPEDCNGHSQSCGILSSDIFIFPSVLVPPSIYFSPITVLFLLFPSSFAFFPRLFLLLLPL